MLPEQPGRVEQQVVEVHGAGLGQPLLVLPVHLGDAPLVDRLGPVVVLVDGDEVVLGRTDDRRHLAGRKLLRVQTEVADHIAGQPGRVGIVVDGERRREAESGGFPAEDADAGRVEGRDPHLLGHGSDQPGHPALHLVGGLVGERDGEDLERRDVVVADQMGDPVGQNPGLARPGTGDDEQRTRVVGDRLPLHRIEALERVGPDEARPSRLGLGFGFGLRLGRRVAHHGPSTLPVGCDGDEQGVGATGVLESTTCAPTS